MKRINETKPVYNKTFMIAVAKLHFINFLFVIGPQSPAENYPLGYES